MAITFRATAVLESASTNSAVCNKPTGTVNDDIMFAWIQSNTALNNSAPSGWASLGTRSLTGGYYQLYWKKASSEGSNYTWGFASAQKVKITIATYYGGYNLSDPIKSTSNTSYVVSNTTCRAATQSIGGGLARSPMIFFGACYNTSSTTFTKPANIDIASWTEDYDGGSVDPDFWATICSMTTSFTGTTGSVDATLSATLTNKTAMMVVLNPATTEGENRYWVGGTGNWNDTAGTKWSLTSGGTGNKSVPNIYDNVYFNGSSGSGTTTFSATNGCLALNFTGYTGTFTNSAILYIYGNVTLASGMTFGSSSGSWRLRGSSDQNWTSNTKTINIQIQKDVGAGVMQLQDTFISTSQLYILIGGLNTNNYNMTLPLLSLSSSSTRAVTLGSSTIELNATSSSGGTDKWDAATTTNLTFNAGTSTIKLTGTPSTNFWFAGGGLTYYNVEFKSASATYYTSIRQSNTFTSLTLDPDTINWFIDGTTQTVGSLTATGTAGNEIVLKSSAIVGSVVTQTIISNGTGYTDGDTATLTGGGNNCQFTWDEGGATWNKGSVGSGYTAGVTYNTTGGTGSGFQVRPDTVSAPTGWTLSDTSGTNSVSYCNISYSTATGGATWNAFTSNGNVDSGNNSGWIFTSASGPTNLKSYNTNLKANIKSIDTNLIANIKSLNTNT